MHIIQLTDLHLTEDKNARLHFSHFDYDLYTWESLAMVLDEIHDQVGVPDLFVITGDIAQDETEKNYQQIAEYLESFPAPVYCLPGNHDRQPFFNNYLSGHNIFNDDHVLFKQWQFIFLDSSHKEDTPSGRLYPEEFERLAQLLKAEPEKHTLIFVHHQPMPINHQWMDPMMLENGGELLTLLAGYKNIKALFHGHVHQDFQGKFAHFPIFATPSTCVQITPGEKSFDMSKAPAYRSLQLYDDGHMENRLYYLDNGIERLYGTSTLASTRSQTG